MAESKYKSKRQVSTSESSDEEVQIKKKKAKKTSKPEEVETVFSLGKKRKVSVREFKGKIMVDIREFYEGDDGELKPGRKGIALMVDQWQKLKENMDAIDEAVKSIG